MLSDRAMDMIRQGTNHISDLYRKCGMTGEDFNKFHLESPKVMAAIDMQQESLNRPETHQMKDEEVFSVMDKLIKNWELVFNKRQKIKTST